MIRLLLPLTFLLVCVPLGAQVPGDVFTDPRYIWGEGWGRTAEEADREALAALAGRVSIALSSTFRSVEEQRSGTHGRSHFSMQSSSLSLSSCVSLPNTGSSSWRVGRRYHAYRWALRRNVESLFSDRKARALEYEESALAAEREGRLDDALRCHYWAYTILRSVARPSDVRDSGGRILLGAIPERMNSIFGSIDVSARRGYGDALELEFRRSGKPVKSLTVSFFNGAKWVTGIRVRDGKASARYACGAPGTIVQLRIEYEHRDEAMMDSDLAQILSSSDIKPLGKSYVIFRR